MLEIALELKPIYRLDLGREVDLSRLTRVAGYLANLGVGTICLSPALTPWSASARGGAGECSRGDDPWRSALPRLAGVAGELRGHGLGLMLEVLPGQVPATSRNPWWMDVLAHGRASVYAGMFDIDWDPGPAYLRGRIVLPVLADPYFQVLEDARLQVRFESGAFLIAYDGERLPVDPRTYPLLLGRVLDRLRQTPGQRHGMVSATAELMSELESLPDREEVAPERLEARFRRAAGARLALRELVTRDAELRAALVASLREMNGQPGVQGSFDRLDELLGRQVYWLASTSGPGEKERNYRGGRDAETPCIALRVEEPEVFQATHELVLGLLRSGIATGVRLTGTESLRRPGEYLRRLAEALRGGTDILVLDPSGGTAAAAPTLPHRERGDGPELLPAGEALELVREAVMSRYQGLEQIGRCYRRLTGDRRRFARGLQDARVEAAERWFAADLGMLSRQLTALARQDRYARELGGEEMRQALLAVTAELAVRRTHGTDGDLPPAEHEHIERAIGLAEQQDAAARPPLWAFLRRALGGAGGGPAEDRTRARLGGTVLETWQPLAAAAAVRGRAAARGALAGAPLLGTVLGLSPGQVRKAAEVFHQVASRLAGRAVVAADRGEADWCSQDQRCRLSVLTEIPARWQRLLHRWCRMNRSRRTRIRGELVPNRREELVFYELLVACWPLAGNGLAELRSKLPPAFVHVVRNGLDQGRSRGMVAAEAAALEGYAAALLSPEAENAFLREFRDFVAAPIFYGAINSLGLEVMRLLGPEVPEIAEGHEAWVSGIPGQKRPTGDLVQGPTELAVLDTAGSDGRAARELLARWPDGRAKAHVIHRLLALRAGLAGRGTALGYRPITVRGHWREHVVAFARTAGEFWVLAVVPRWLSRIVPLGTFPLGSERWKDTALELPDEAPGEWQEVLAGERHTLSAGAQRLPVGTVLRHLPVAVLRSW